MSVKLELVIVDPFIARENVALTVVPVVTFVAPLAGTVDVTVGGPVGFEGVISIAATSGSSADP